MYASTHWLSVYKTTISTVYMSDVLIVFYHAFLSIDDRSLYQSRLDAIYSRRKVSDETKKAIQKHPKKEKANKRWERTEKEDL